MRHTEQVEARVVEVAKIAESKTDLAELRKHVKEIVEGPSFKGSSRSARFLNHILDQAIEGNLEALKERVIGVELFRRDPSYDTGEDAIVRVTASDVRRRLLQHYGRHGTDSGFRVDLPIGSYFPEISRVFGQGNASPEQHSSANSSNAGDEGGVQQLKPPEALIPSREIGRPSAPDHSRLKWFFIALAVGLGIAFGSAFWHPFAVHTTAPNAVLPWSALFSAQHTLQLITSDPNIAEIQAITGAQLSVTDYANRNYLAGPNKLSPEVERFCRRVLIGGKSATLDAQIAVAVTQLTRGAPQVISVLGAREIQLKDLRNDHNFIFIGSPRSNPWVSLFDDQLDFRFVFDPHLHSEYLINAHPQPKELDKYVPTAIGGATGDTFAIIALVENPDHNGHVLLLAGADGEGTDAAGKLVTDVPRFSVLLQHCGVGPSGAIQPFEFLLHVGTIAGSPDRTDVVACHKLAGTALKLSRAE